jgi:hypothetical protein
MAGECSTYVMKIFIKKSEEMRPVRVRRTYSRIIIKWTIKIQSVHWIQVTHDRE